MLIETTTPNFLVVSTSVEHKTLIHIENKQKIKEITAHTSTNEKNLEIVFFLLLIRTSFYGITPYINNIVI